MNAIRNWRLLGAALAVWCAVGGTVEQGTGVRQAKASVMDLSAEEREALLAAAAPALNEMRAGAPDQSAIKPEEREELAASQAANPELQNQRAGLTDKELALTLLVVVLAVAVAAAILLLVVAFVSVIP
jgi:hypothetical protein